MRGEGEAALVVEPTNADGPSVVDVADAVGVGDAHVGEELLAELVGTVEHLDAMQLDAGCVHRHQEHAQAAVLLDVPVRAGQAEPVVGTPRARAPDLRPAEQPLVAVAHGRRPCAGGVGRAARFGQELHEDVLALEDRRDVPELLLVRAEVEDDRHARREVRHAEHTSGSRSR